MFNKFPLHHRIVLFIRNVEKYGTAGQATDEEIIWPMHFALWTSKATHVHPDYVTVTDFHVKNGLANAHRLYVIRALPFCLFRMRILIGPDDEPRRIQARPHTSPRNLWRFYFLYALLSLFLSYSDLFKYCCTDHNQ
jgi:hypothetical protein